MSKKKERKIKKVLKKVAGVFGRKGKTGDGKKTVEGSKINEKKRQQNDEKATGDISHANVPISMLYEQVPLAIPKASATASSGDIATIDVSVEIEVEVEVEVKVDDVPTIQLPASLRAKDDAKSVAFASKDLKDINVS